MVAQQEVGGRLVTCLLHQELAAPYCHHHVLHQEPAVPFGLLQRRGGSCGVMASVQALLLAKLLEGHHRDSTSASTTKSHARVGEASSSAASRAGAIWAESLSQSQRDTALVYAITSIVWAGRSSVGCKVRFPFRLTSSCLAALCHTSPHFATPHLATPRQTICHASLHVRFRF